MTLAEKTSPQVAMIRLAGGEKCSLGQCASGDPSEPQLLQILRALLLFGALALDNARLSATGDLGFRGRGLAEFCSPFERRRRISARDTGRFGQGRPGPKSTKQLLDALLRRAHAPSAVRLRTLPQGRKADRESRLEWTHGGCDLRPRGCP